MGIIEMWIAWAIAPLPHFLANFNLGACPTKKLTTRIQPPLPTLNRKITSATSRRIINIAYNLIAPQRSALKMPDVECRNLLRLQENFATKSKPKYKLPWQPLVYLFIY